LGVCSKNEKDRGAHSHEKGPRGKEKKAQTKKKNGVRLKNRKPLV